MTLLNLRDTLAQIAREETSGSTRRARITATVTKELTHIWDNALSSNPDTNPEGIALVAVGSLGRGDMGPMSDLDLLVVYDPQRTTADAAQTIAPHVWYPLWDAGLDLDHSVRSLAQCRQVASHDIAAAVGMLTMTWIAGDKHIAHDASSAILTDWRHAARTRLASLRTSIHHRHEQFGDVAYSLDPHIKEGRGGLRDAQVLDAIAASWLTDRSHGELDDAIEWIHDVRDAIHLVTARHANTLLAVDRADVAAHLGYDDPDDLVRDLAHAARRIAFELDVTIRRAIAVLTGGSGIQRTLLIRGKRSAPRLRYVAPSVVELAGELVLPPPPPGGYDPLVSLHLAVASARTGLPISGSVVPSLSAMPPLTFPWSAPARSLFDQLLASGPALADIWEVFDIAGVTSGWIPEWDALRHRPQRAPIHRHTLDRHLIETVMRVRPWRSQVARSESLFLAALLHDIGKPAGGVDHAAYGAEMVGPIVERMGYSPTVVADVRCVVAHHLTLAQWATTRDVEDPAVAGELADALEGNVDRLVMLRGVTEADGSSLGEAGWSSWRARLVDDLFQATLRVMNQ